MVISRLRSSEMGKRLPTEILLLKRCAHLKITKCLKPSLLEDVGRSTLVVRQSKKTVWPVKMEPICCLEMPVTA